MARRASSSGFRRGLAGLLASLLAVGLAAGSAPSSALAGSADAGEPDRTGPAPSDAGASSSFVLASRRGVVVPPDLDDVEHMCALLTGCASLPISSSLIGRDFVSCVRRMSEEMTSPGAVQFSLTMRECGLRASSCSELRTCALRGARPDACAGRGKQSPVSYCDPDGRAITCSQEQVTAVRDCPRGGEQCAIKDGQAVCTLGTCEADSPRACSGSGTKIVQCDRGKLLSLDCAALGLRCAMGADGPGCATTGPACSSSAKRCDGDVAVGCFNGHEVRIECGAAGLACASSPDAVAVGSCAMPAASACDPDAPARCDGAILKYCAAGKARGYFCRSLGLSKCVSDARGARCVP